MDDHTFYSSVSEEEINENLKYILHVNYKERYIFRDPTGIFTKILYKLFRVVHNFEKRSII